MVIVPVPNVETPETFNCCTVKFVAVVTPSVETPVTFKDPSTLNFIP